MSATPEPEDRPGDALTRSSKLFDLTTLLQVGSVVLVLLLLLKAYGVARYSVVTGGELVTGAPVAIALGTLALYEPAVYPLVSACLAWWLYDNRREGRVHLQAAATLACLVAAALSPVLYLLVAYGAALVFFGLYQLGKHVHERTPTQKQPLAAIAMLVQLRAGFMRRPLGYFVAVAAAIFVLATLETPWVPAEVLVTKSSILIDPKHNERDSTPVVFVLNESNGEVFVLAAQSRAVVRIPADDVVGRIVCYQPGLGLGGRPLFDFVIGRQSTTPYLSCNRLQEELRSGAVRP